MILGMEYERVPDFVDEHRELWARALGDWIEPMGLGLIIPKEIPLDFAHSKIPSLMIGDVGRFWENAGHSTVWFDGVEYDPKPGYGGLERVERIYFVVPLGLPQPKDAEGK